MTKKVSRIAVVLTVVLVLTLSTGIAAGIISWHRGLEDMLRVSDETKDYYQATNLFDEPGMSVKQGDVTVTLEQSIVDTNAAYFAFRVKGYQPPKGMQPAFASTDYAPDDESIIAYADASFFDGLVINSEGMAVYLDGSIPDDYSALPYTDENGELVYMISMFTDTSNLIGQKMTITLTDLGVYVDKWGTHEVHAPGTWTFTWTLKGTDSHLDLNDLSLDIGASGSKVTDIHLSPIHIQMKMEVEPSLREYEQLENNDAVIPYFYGVQLKDGTTYDFIADAGRRGYTSPDPEEHEYKMLYVLDRIIEPSNVDCLLFTFPNESGEREIVEVKLY